MKMRDTERLNHAALRANQAGLLLLRYGLVALLVLWGGFKFAAFEAEGIRPLVENSPLLSWLYPLFGVRGTSAIIGVVELAAALLITLRRWRPALSALGSVIAAGTFLVTLSFLVTTPGALSPTSPFGGFLMKDIMLLGAALFTAGEAWRAASHRHPVAADTTKLAA
jgi:reactive chlorine resistance protein C